MPMPESRASQGGTIEFARVSAKVVGVTDGDTITVLRGSQQTKIRIWGIDSPEMGQPFGKTAKAAASKLLFGEWVTFEPGEKDRYGRTLSKVTMADGRDFGAVMIASGYAWHYVQYAPRETTYADLQELAKTKKRGLWVDEAAVAPWEWRRIKQKP